MTYFLPMHGDFRTYLNGTFCCTGSGIENTPRDNEGIYYRQGDALWVSLYIPSELEWRQAGMAIRQEGDILAGEPVRFTIVKAGADAVSVNFRIPSWIAKPATVSVNGKVEEPAGKAGTFVTVKRQWKAGDVVALTLPASLRLEKAKDDPAMVAIFFGPVLLAGALGREGCRMILPTRMRTSGGRPPRFRTLSVPRRIRRIGCRRFPTKSRRSRRTMRDRPMAWRSAGV